MMERLVTWIVVLTVMQATGTCVLPVMELIILIWVTVFHWIINHASLILGLTVTYSQTHLNYIAILLILLDFVLVTLDTATTVFLRAGTSQLTELKFHKLKVKMAAIAIHKMGRIAYKTMVWIVTHPMVISVHP